MDNMKEGKKDRLEYEYQENIERREALSENIMAEKFPYLMKYSDLGKHKF